MSYTAPALSVAVSLTSGYTAPALSIQVVLDEPALATGIVKPASLCYDVQDGGEYRITSIVRKLNVPGPYRVRLFERNSGRLIRETWSDASGAFSFDFIKYIFKGYFIVAFDHGGSPFNPDSIDYITPVPIPR